MNTPTPMSSKLAEKVAQPYRSLRPFQTLECDPTTHVISIISETVVPSRTVEHFNDILAGRRTGDTSGLRRLADSQRINLIRQIKS